MPDLVLNLNQVAKDDANLVGAKGANLGEMLKIGLLIPEGFVLTIESFNLFLKESALDSQLPLLLAKVDATNPERLSEISSLITSLIHTAKFPVEIQTSLEAHYKNLSENHFNPLAGEALCAIRSSATGEDSALFSFAGQNNTSLCISGLEQIITEIKNCWASAFSPRTLKYHKSMAIPTSKIQMAVVVQRIIDSEKAGVVFSVNPVSADKNILVIEAVWGLGELLVSGEIPPDHYEIDRKSHQITFRQISPQTEKLCIQNNSLVKIPLDKTRMLIPKLSESEIEQLTNISLQLQTHYYFPQDSEFAFSKGKLYMLQTRPITTLPMAKDDKQETPIALPMEENVVPPFLTGIPLSGGIATSQARILTGPVDIKKIHFGDIVIVPSLFPLLLPELKKMRGLVSEDDDPILSDQIKYKSQMPFLVGVLGATKKIKDNAVISIDGAKGEIFEGKIKSGF